MYSFKWQNSLITQPKNDLVGELLLTDTASYKLTNLKESVLAQESSASMQEEYLENGANSYLLDIVSFVWRLGKRALSGARVLGPPYISPDAT